MTKATKHRVLKVEDLPVGSRKMVEVGKRSVGVFNVNGEIVAVLNICPHEFAPVCAGRVGGTTAPSLPGEPLKWIREGEILFCPWHGWEFDLLTGECLTDRRKIRRFATSIEEGWVHVHLRQQPNVESSDR